METIALNKDQHPQSLERLCVSALSSGDAEAAFMFADRRCRILPHAGPHHLTLRAEALMRLGDQDGALSDVLSALGLSPEDVQANRRLLSWGDAAQRAAAARALIALDDDAEVLARALAVLSADGCAAAGAARMTDDTIMGWAAWNGPVAPTLGVADHQAEATVLLVADPDHPLAGHSFEHVAGFDVRRTLSPTGHAVRLALLDAEFFRTRGGANARTPDGERGIARSGSEASAEVTVIVPIYRDYRATRTCLESLAAETVGKTQYRVILVDDATPEPRLAKFLRTFSRKSGVLLLTNDSNLGFVGSVNRAIELVAGGDAVLLNADTIVPAGFLARMTAIARSDPTIGTITPLSNNGEFTSFPVPFELNLLPSPAVIGAIDALAAEINRGEVVDLPNGIGFCLYVTRSCLDRVGLLSHAYRRGYLEDVDFCLRARELGFRNVCATSIYVGHAGSRSFGADKRALVVRNIAVAEERFPDYRQECALFMTADPLRHARGAIERQLKFDRRMERLLVSGGGLLATVAAERAARLLKRGKRALLLCAQHNQLTLRASDGGAPQSLTFATNSAGLRDLSDYLRAIEPESVEIVEPAAVSDMLLQMLTKLGLPVRVLAADAGLICPRGTLIQPDGRVCSTLGTNSLCASCLPSCNGKAVSRAQWQDRWGALDEKSIVLADARGRGFASLLTNGARLPDRAASTKTHAASAASRKARIGLVVQSATVDEFRSIQQLLRGALRRFPGQTYVVVGETADDLALIAAGNAFVSGAVDADRCAAVFRQYGLKKVFLPLRRPLYGHPLSDTTRRTGLPMAYLDWSFGLNKPRQEDLAIDPRCDTDELLTLLSQWVEA